MEVIVKDFLVGENDKNYYSIFEDFESGRWNCWNWWAFIFGPIWYLNRRIDTIKVLLSSLVFSIIAYYLLDGCSQPYSYFFVLVLYLAVYVIPANYFYYREMTGYVSENAAVTKEMMTSRFRTELRRGRHNMSQLR